MSDKKTAWPVRITLLSLSVPKVHISHGQTQMLRKSSEDVTIKLSAMIRAQVVSGFCVIFTCRL